MVKLDAGGHPVATFGAAGAGDGQNQGLTGIAIGADGSVVVSDWTANRIQKFDSQGRFVTEWSTEPPPGVAGLAVGPDGNVYGANHRTHQHYVQKFSPTGQLLAQWGGTGRGPGLFQAGDIGGPEGIAVASDGTVFVADAGGGQLQAFGPDGQASREFGRADLPGNPFAVAADPRRRLWATDGRVMVRFSSSGTADAVISAERPAWPARLGHMAIDRAGDMYAVYVVLGILKKFHLTGDVQ